MRSHEANDATKICGQGIKGVLCFLLFVQCKIFGLRGPVSAFDGDERSDRDVSLTGRSTTPRFFDKSHSQQRLDTLGLENPIRTSLHM